MGMDQGDPEAFRALYRTHYRTVCRYLALRAHADHVEDVAAETFLVAWRKQRELPDDHVVPWLLNAAGKCLANQRRSRARSEALVQRLADMAAAAGGRFDDDVARGAQRRALLAALAAVSDTDRELLMLRHWDGLPPRDIALVVDISPVALRARLHRSQRRLQRALRDALAEEGDCAAAVELIHAS